MSDWHPVSQMHSPKAMYPFISRISKERVTLGFWGGFFCRYGNKSAMCTRNAAVLTVKHQVKKGRDRSQVITACHIMPYPFLDSVSGKKNGAALGLLTLPDHQRAQFIFSGVALQKLASSGED